MCVTGGLNPRGIRESELRERLISDREFIESKIKKFSHTKKFNVLKTDEELEADEEKAKDNVAKIREKNTRNACFFILNFLLFNVYYLWSLF